MMTGAFGRLLRCAAVLALAGLTVGCASPHNPGQVTAPAGYGSDPASRAERLVQYCDRLIEKDELVTALGLCARAHEVNPDDPEILMKVATILKKMNRREAAAETYSALLAQHPRHQEARYSLGKLYMETGEAAMASIQFSHAMRDFPEDPRSYNALGILRDQEGEHEAAQGLYRQALLRDPANTSVRNNLGLSLALDGKRDEAIDVLAELAVDPTADQIMLRNLEAAYASRAVLAPAPADNAVMNDTPVSSGAIAPAADSPTDRPEPLMPASEPKALPVKATDAPAAPVEVKPVKAPAAQPQMPKALPKAMPATTPRAAPRTPFWQQRDARNGKTAPQSPEAGKPTPLYIPRATHDDDLPSSDAPPSKRTLNQAPPAAVVPLSPASSVILAAADRLMQPPAWADFEPGALLDDLPPPAAAPAPAPAPAEVPQEGSLGEISVDPMDLSLLVPHERRPAPYALSMLIIAHDDTNA